MNLKVVWYYISSIEGTTAIKHKLDNGKLNVISDTTIYFTESAFSQIQNVYSKYSGLQLSPRLIAEIQHELNEAVRLGILKGGISTLAMRNSVVIERDRYYDYYTDKL